MVVCGGCPIAENQILQSTLPAEHPTVTVIHAHDESFRTIPLPFHCSGQCSGLWVKSRHRHSHGEAELGPDSNQIFMLPTHLKMQMLSLFHSGLLSPSAEAILWSLLSCSSHPSVPGIMIPSNSSISPSLSGAYAAVKQPSRQHLQKKWPALLCPVVNCFAIWCKQVYTLETVSQIALNEAWCESVTRKMRDGKQDEADCSPPAPG